MAQLQHALLSAVLVAWASSSALAFLNLPGFPDQEQVDTICGDRVHLLNENGTDADECIFGTNGVRGGERGKDGWMDGWMYPQPALLVMAWRRMKSCSAMAAPMSFSGWAEVRSGSGHLERIAHSCRNQRERMRMMGVADDYLIGGDGNDTLYGGSGDDIIFAGSDGKGGTFF